MMDNQKHKGQAPWHEIELANGCTLYRKRNQVGGFDYVSDEIGGGALVWDTALISPATLLRAIVDFNEYNDRLRYLENENPFVWMCYVCDTVRPD